MVSSSPAASQQSLSSDNYYQMQPMPPSDYYPMQLEEVSTSPQNQHHVYQIMHFEDAHESSSMMLPPPPPPPPLLPPDTSNGYLGIPSESAMGCAPTTIMLRNLQEDLSQPALVEQLMQRGYTGLFDFVYMPMNFRGHGNFGYAFVNFVSHMVSMQFINQISGELCAESEVSQRWVIAWSTCQGLAGNIDRYRNSPLMHDLVPRECKPALYNESGCQVSFPHPTKTIPKPRVHWPGPREAKTALLKDRDGQEPLDRDGGQGDIGDSRTTLVVPERRPGRSKNHQRQRTADVRTGELLAAR